jgi:TRAP-type C4-dicarboxylate transport system substrate-binding protein
MSMSLTRRTLLSRASIAAAGALGAPAILHWPAHAAEFSYKYGTALPDGHPMVIRSREAVTKIKEESGGKLDITLYTASVLGQDTAMMSQAIAGALEIYGMSLDILAQKSPSAAIFGVGFAFPNYEVAWKAMDGDLGGYCRGLSEKVGLYCMDKAFDHGFREITSKAKRSSRPRTSRASRSACRSRPYSSRCSSISARRRPRSILARCTAPCRRDWSTVRKIR